VRGKPACLFARQLPVIVILFITGAHFVLRANPARV